MNDESLDRIAVADNGRWRAPLCPLRHVFFEGNVFSHRKRCTFDAYAYQTDEDYCERPTVAPVNRCAWPRFQREQCDEARTP